MRNFFLLFTILHSLTIMSNVVFTQTKQDLVKKPNSYEEYQNIFPEKKPLLLFSTYHNNYLLFYDSPSKLQFSLRYKLFFDSQSQDKSGFYLAYTHLALLELFQTDEDYTSSPSIDQNFMPEVFYLIDPETISWFSLQVGFMHQSNGQGGWEAFKSVSWNQIYIEPQFHVRVLDGYLYTRIRFFIPSDLSENKDILDYTGFSQINISYSTIFAKTVGFSIDILLRKGLKSYYGAFSLGTTIGPFFLDRIIIPVAIFIELWSGYGESLLNYKNNYTKIRLGISLPIF